MDNKHINRISLTSAYNFTSGYDIILKTLLNNLKYQIVPRTFNPVDKSYLKYFSNVENIKYDGDLLDLGLFPLNNTSDSTNIFFCLQKLKNRLLYTMWESTRVNDLLIELLNSKFECIIFPNNFNKKNFINQGLKIRSEVIPLFCDTDFYVYKEPKDRDEFIFGISNEDPRKNIKKVTQCFLKAFSDKKNVKLKIKTTDTKINDIISDKLILDVKHFTREELRNWYHDLDVYVSGVTCEGWGMMQQESMCCGRPLIYTNYGGLSEYTDKTSGFEIGYDEVYSTGYWGGYGGRWTEFNEDEMIEQMIYCYNNRDEVVEKGKLAVERANKFTINRFIKNIESLIDSYIKH